MKMRALALSAFILTALSSHSLGAEERGDSIVREMDARMNFTSCRMTILIQDEKSGGRSRSLRAKVEYLDKAGTRIEFFEPARDKGKRILMAGDSMWMASPGVSKAVRLSGEGFLHGHELHQ
jgi:outer membrane lipoprotein-sorting protein